MSLTFVAGELRKALAACRGIVDQIPAFTKTEVRRVNVQQPRLGGVFHCRRSGTGAGQVRDVCPGPRAK